MTVPATYRDGAFHPDAPVDLPDGTRGAVSVGSLPPSHGGEYLGDTGDGRLDNEPEAPASGDYAWLTTLMEADLDLPPDFSENHDDYLAGRKLYKGRRYDGKDLG